MAVDLLEFETTWTSERRESLLRGEVVRDMASAGWARAGAAGSDALDAEGRLDPFQFLGRPSVLRRVTELLSARVPRQVDRVAGVGRGGTVLATAVSLTTGIPFSVANDPHPSVAGERPVLDFTPDVHRGEAVVLVVDVLKRGVRLVEAVKTLQEAGANVVSVFAVIDGEAGGARLLESVGCDSEKLFSLSELRF